MAAQACCFDMSYEVRVDVDGCAIRVCVLMGMSCRCMDVSIINMYLSDLFLQFRWMLPLSRGQA